MVPQYFPNQNQPLIVPPNRAHAITRRAQLAQAAQALPHGYHVFCKKCASEFWLGETTFKLYLLIAWCLGLGAIMSVNKSNKDKPIDYISTAVYCMFYLISQIFGLLACVSRITKLFAPYMIVLSTTILLNILYVVYPMVPADVKDPAKIEGLALFQINNIVYTHGPAKVILISILLLVYHLLCAFSVLHLCTENKKRKVAESQRRRDMIIQNLLMYEQIMNMNRQRENAATAVNPDSPPKYSSLDSKHPMSEMSPPRYSQIGKQQEAEEDEQPKTPVWRLNFDDDVDV